MKLHITYNVPDLTQAITLAEQTAEYADILGVGSLLLFREGVRAIKTFKASFPDKDIFAEARLTEKAPEAVNMMANAGASYISILAGAYTSTIKKAVDAAKSSDVKIALDLLDAQSIGQTALDAKTLGVHVLILHRTPSGPRDIAELEAEWHNVRENTNVPIFITGKITEDQIESIIALKPHGLMVGTAITKADHPAKVAHAFKTLIMNK